MQVRALSPHVFLGSSLKFASKHVFQKWLFITLNYSASIYATNHEKIIPKTQIHYSHPHSYQSLFKLNYAFMSPFSKYIQQCLAKSIKVETQCAVGSGHPC